MRSNQKINFKLLEFHRKQRSLQLEQIRNSMRFTKQFEIYERIEEDDNHDHYEFDERKLIRIIDNENLEELYEAVVKTVKEEGQVFENCVVEVVNFLKKCLTSPIALISLGSLITNLQIYGQTVLASGCFQLLIKCIEKLAPGSESQNIYVWTLCALTDRPSGLNQKQEKLLLNIAERILAINLEKDTENILLVRLVKNLSEMNIVLNEELAVSFSNLYWKTDSQVSKINIYLTCSRMILTRNVHRSTKVLLHLLAVCLRGRGHLELQAATISQMFPSMFTMLTVGLQTYNEEWQSMQAECQFEIHGKSMNLGLHSFLLTFESSLFSCDESSDQYFLFLKLFSMHAPMELTVLKWFELGTFYYLTSKMARSVDISYQILQIINLICQRIVKEESGRSWLLQKIKSQSRVEETVEEALHETSNKRVAQLCEHILAMLEGGDCKIYV